MCPRHIDGQCDNRFRVCRQLSNRQQRREITQHEPTTAMPRQQATLSIRLRRRDGHRQDGIRLGWLDAHHRRPRQC